MKKTVYVIFTILCFAVLVVPSLGMLIAGPSEAGANEIQSEKPFLKTEDGFNTLFLSQLSDYASDHFFLRQELITAHNSIVSSLFGVSAEEDVILGKDGWLYYSSTLDDYTGRNQMTVRELYSAASNLRLISEYVNSRGAKFLFIIAPNKNSLYPQYMPDFGAVAKYRNADAVMALLDSFGVAHTDFFKDFASESEILYFKHDSHWNSRGAALGADLINSAFGLDTDYYGDPFTGSESHTGDLFEMVYPTGRDSEKNPVYGGELSPTYENPNHRPDSITINASGNGEGNLLMFRDSFGNLLYPYLADTYKNSRFSRSTVYDLSAMEELSADYVAIELVERNLRYLVDYTPVMPSPLRDVALPDVIGGLTPGEFDETVRAPEGYAAFKGTALGADDYSPVYLLLGSQCYEAFLGADGLFTVYVPESAVQSECFVAYTVDGELILTRAVSQ